MTAEPEKRAVDGFTTEITPELHAELWEKHIGTSTPPVRLRAFTCTDHAGRWAVGTASIIVAPDEATARKLLDDELTSRRLGGGTFTLTELDTTKPQALVLRDGEY